MDSQNMILAAALIGAGYYYYTNYMTVKPVAAPVTVTPLVANTQTAYPGPQIATQEVGPNSAIPATAAAGGDIKNAATPSTAVEKYYGVGGVEFRSQGLNRNGMRYGPSYGPNCRK